MRNTLTPSYSARVHKPLSPTPTIPSSPPCPRGTDCHLSIHGHVYCFAIYSVRKSPPIVSRTIQTNGPEPNLLSLGIPKRQQLFYASSPAASQLPPLHSTVLISQPSYDDSSIIFYLADSNRRTSQDRLPRRAPHHLSESTCLIFPAFRRVVECDL